MEKQLDEFEVIIGVQILNREIERLTAILALEHVSEIERKGIIERIEIVKTIVKAVRNNPYVLSN
jgi:hypothetical protein